VAARGGPVTLRPVRATPCFICITDTTRPQAEAVPDDNAENNAESALLFLQEQKII